MSNSESRLGRIRNFMQGYAACARRRSAAMLIAGVAVALSAAPAQAATGGASTAAATAAQAGGGLAFSSMRSAGATWYGPGFFGSRTACGQVLRPGTIGVAHRSLPCGTAVKFLHRGRVLVTRVIDRGPFTSGNAWDLTSAASEALDFDGSGRIRYAIALGRARR
jgi:rare lipoprotein A (peptidoglycan hydrolase)